MLHVIVTIAVQGRTVPVDQVRDRDVASALRQMGREVGTKLERIRCPVHAKGPTDVRIHVGPGGNADIKYESCCPELGRLVQAAL